MRIDTQKLIKMTIDTVKDWSKWQLTLSKIDQNDYWHSKIDQNEDWHCQKLIKNCVQVIFDNENFDSVNGA